jgi:hypothetical protein
MVNFAFNWNWNDGDVIFIFWASFLSVIRDATGVADMLPFHMLLKNFFFFLIFTLMLQGRNQKLSTLLLKANIFHDSNSAGLLHSLTVIIF